MMRSGPPQNSTSNRRDPLLELFEVEVHAHGGDADPVPSESRVALLTHEFGIDLTYGPTRESSVSLRTASAYSVLSDSRCMAVEVPVSGPYSLNFIDTSVSVVTDAIDKILRIR